MRTGSRAAGAVAIGVTMVIVVPPAPSFAAGCGGRPPTISGTSGRDQIRGTAGDDVIAAGAGGDLVTGRGGDDRICGSGGADLLSGRGGGDLIIGAAGGDVLEGGPGRDRLDAGAGSDFLDGQAGGDVLSGGTGATDLLRGRGGHDRLLGRRGFDILIGDAGNDLLHGGGGRVDLATFVRARHGMTVDLARGRATGEGRDVVRGVEDVEGTRFDDVMIGNGRQNFLVPLGGNDVVDGVGGLDQALFLTSLAPVVVDLSTGTAEGEGIDSLASVEGAYGSAFDDSLSGDDGANFLFGYEGDDLVMGDDGDDVLDGDSGVDDADGGDGTDICANFENGALPTNCESTTFSSGIRRVMDGIGAADLLADLHAVLR
jgi:Ca2+-binding RTX toxin-like protein